MNEPTEEKDNRSEWILDIEPDAEEIVKDRGFSILDIRIRIDPNRPIDVQYDVDFRFDGRPLEGLCGLEFSSVPPYVGMTILDREKFQNSINKAGFFFQQGVYVRQILFGRTYPAVLCGECAGAGREGYLSVQHGGMCSNPECSKASNLSKAQAQMKKHLAEQKNEETVGEELPKEDQ